MFYAFIKKNIFLLIFLGFAMATLIFDFKILGVYQINGDTPNYIDAINYISGHDIGQPVYFYLKVRLLKPIYEIFGWALAPIFSPATAILALNILFFFGTGLLLFFILKKMGFKDSYSALGSCWLVSSYPVLKYGLGLLTDMGGYFFIALTVLLILKALETKRLVWFMATGAAIALGGLTKETGAFGVFFALGAILIKSKDTGWKFAFKSSLSLIATCAIIFIPIQFLISYWLNQNYLDFWVVATSASDRTLKTFIGIYGGAFQVLWIYVLFGFMAWRKEKKDWIWWALWLIGLPTLFWNSYVTRYAFVLFAAVIPFSLLGLQSVLSRIHKFRLPAKIILCALPPLVSAILIIIIKNQNFLSLLKLI